MENQPVQENKPNGNNDIKQFLKWQYIAIAVAIIVGLSLLFGYLFSSKGPKEEVKAKAVENQKVEKKSTPKETYTAPIEDEDYLDDDEDLWEEEEEYNEKYEVKEKEVKPAKPANADKPKKADKPKAEKPKADKPKAEKQKADKQKADKPKADKPKKEEKPKKVTEDNDFSKMKVYKKVKCMPEFPGGEQKMNAFIAKNLRPQGKKGQVVVSFIVEPNGTISNVEVEQSLNGACDKEAMRLVKSFPKWTPGSLKQNGKPVRVNMSLPINFK